MKKQIQQEPYTGKGGIYQQLTLPISENILIEEHEPVYVANAQLEQAEEVVVREIVYAE